MDATATPRGTPARVIARDNSTFPRSLRPSTVFVDSVLVKPAPTRPRGLFSFEQERERSMQQHYAGLDLASRIERLARVTMMV